MSEDNSVPAEALVSSEPVKPAKKVRAVRRLALGQLSRAIKGDVLQKFHRKVSSRLRSVPMEDLNEVRRALDIGFVESLRAAPKLKVVIDSVARDERTPPYKEEDLRDELRALMSATTGTLLSKGIILSQKRASPKRLQKEAQDLSAAAAEYAPARTFDDLFGFLNDGSTPVGN